MTFASRQIESPHHAYIRTLRSREERIPTWPQEANQVLPPGPGGFLSGLVLMVTIVNIALHVYGYAIETAFQSAVEERYVGVGLAMGLIVRLIVGLLCINIFKDKN